MNSDSDDRGDQLEDTTSVRNTKDKKEVEVWKTFRSG